MVKIEKIKKMVTDAMKDEIGEYLRHPTEEDVKALDFLMQLRRDNRITEEQFAIITAWLSDYLLLQDTAWWPAVRFKTVSDWTASKLQLMAAEDERVPAEISRMLTWHAFSDVHRGMSDVRDDWIIDPVFAAGEICIQREIDCDMWANELLRWLRSGWITPDAAIAAAERVINGPVRLFYCSLVDLAMTYRWWTDPEDVPDKTKFAEALEAMPFLRAVFTQVKA